MPDNWEIHFTGWPLPGVSCIQPCEPHAGDWDWIPSASCGIDSDNRQFGFALLDSNQTSTDGSNIREKYFHLLNSSQQYFFEP
jgi:hypothetical protein